MTTTTKAAHTLGPIHPQYGKPSSSRVKTFEGVNFWSYRRGIAMYVRFSEDFRIRIERNFNLTAWLVSVDGVSLPTKYRSETRALRAAIAKATGGA